MVNFHPISSKDVVMKKGEPSPHMTGQVGELPGDIISPHGKDEAGTWSHHSAQP